MANFDSGVKGYVNAHATVRVHFPIDYKDNADVSCKQCPFFRTNSRSCALNNAICEYPEKHIASECPLTFEIDEEEENENV